MSRLSRKNQLTIPVKVLRQAGLAPGDEVEVRVAGPGRLEVERRSEIVARFAGSLSGVYPPGHLDRLSDEWRE